MTDLESIIETAYEARSYGSISPPDPALCQAIDQIIDKLETGQLRVATKEKEGWIVHSWVKKAILIYFSIHQSVPIPAHFTQFYDKIPLRFSNTTPEQFAEAAARIVPGALIRRGTYIAPNTVLMPSFVNIGAFIGKGTLIDTWATVGSCAQIGENVHISGGVGIGGVLEPCQASPTIIEDNCFIGARSEIVEGVIVEQGSVISMGVYIGQSTKIYDRETQKIYYGRVPAYSVIVPGTLPSADGSHSLAAAIIVKKVDDKTRQKTAINELLRTDECKTLLL